MIKEMYSYIWFVLLECRKKNIKKEDVTFKTSDTVSPYMEVNMDEINFDEVPMENGKYIIPVNPFLRFTETFMIFLDSKCMKYKRIKDAFGNIMLHFMAELDTFEGRSVRENQLELIITEIKNGYFGKRAKDLFENFDELDKYKIVEKIYDLYSYEERLENYKNVIKIIFPSSIIYDNNFSSEDLVIYINSDNSEINLEKFEFINILFLPLGLKTRIFWKNHFGVIDLDMTMKIGNISIY